MDKAIIWFQAHKATLGSFNLGLAVVVVGAGNIYDSMWLMKLGGLFTLIGTTLVGAGAAKSDEFYRDRVELLKTKVDRRNPGSMIPVKDLRKIIDKAVPANDGVDD